MTDTPCLQPQCQSFVAKTRHAGYVRHKNLGEDACAESTEGHNEYMRLKREDKAARKAARAAAEEGIPESVIQ